MFRHKSYSPTVRAAAAKQSALGEATSSLPHTGSGNRPKEIDRAVDTEARAVLQLEKMLLNFYAPADRLGCAAFVASSAELQSGIGKVRMCFAEGYPGVASYTAYSVLCVRREQVRNIKF